METETKGVKNLLTAGVIAGPFFVVVVLIQALTREGFSLARHPASLLSNGDLGWVQVANFVITGLLVIGMAIGARKALRGTKGGTWGPILLGLYGLGFIGGGLFKADPGAGFPPGAPEMTAVLSSNAILHFVAGLVGFFGFIVACFVFAKRFSALGQKGWSKYSLFTGLFFLVAFIGVATGQGSSWSIIGFGIAVVLAAVWLSKLSAVLKKTLPA